MTDEDKPKSADERLSQELGVDVVAVEQQLRFRLDLARLQRGETSELGYLFIDRDRHPNATVVFDTSAEATDALEGHQLIEDLVAEDCLKAYTLPNVSLADIAGREIILP